MTKVVFSEAAGGDLDDVWFYVGKDSIAAADRLVDRLVQAAAPLQDFPEMGAPRDELAPGLRSLRVGAYLIFYRRRKEGMSIERILHGSRDIDSDLF